MRQNIIFFHKRNLLRLKQNVRCDCIRYIIFFGAFGVFDLESFKLKLNREQGEWNSRLDY